VTVIQHRLAANPGALPNQYLCDAWTVDQQRVGDSLPGIGADAVIGRWPSEVDSDAFVRLYRVISDGWSWERLIETPPVAQKLGELARLSHLDREIINHLQHLQYVCQRPRLQLRVEEERTPVSRAKHIPVRAVADLVSNPAAWEHRTLQSIQPSRVLARFVEDQWDLYENRVAVRLVDRLLRYITDRLEYLHRIKKTLEEHRALKYGDELRRTSFRRAERISKLWSHTIDSKSEDDLSVSMQQLEAAHRDLQALLDSRLYKKISLRAEVPLSLKSTNILSNDAHYRKVAKLWRTWVKFGHRIQETHQQRVERRRVESEAWDKFVLHVIARSLSILGWVVVRRKNGWEARREGWHSVTITDDKNGIIELRVAENILRIMPLCADLSLADSEAIAQEISKWDGPPNGTVLVHVGAPISLADQDRARAWSFDGRAVLFGCSPWSIDSEERMGRFLNGWLNRVAALPYPYAEKVPSLPAMPHWDWLQYVDPYLLALRPPGHAELREAENWGNQWAKDLALRAQQAKQAKQAFRIAPKEAISSFQRFIQTSVRRLVGLDQCPLCHTSVEIEPRLGRQANGLDATWWAVCTECGTEWGLKPCTKCGKRFRALQHKAILDDIGTALRLSDVDWPDRVWGLDLWAQPCRCSAAGQFKCPDCGSCTSGNCK